MLVFYMVLVYTFWHTYTSILLTDTQHIVSLMIGMSNTAGTLAAIVGTIGAGFFVENMGSFRGFLMLTSFLYFIAALFWDFVCTGELVDFDEAS